MNKYPDHSKNIDSLKRVEGQIRGIQNMITDRKYCVDILNQVHAAMAALSRVEDSILDMHIKGCVTTALQGKSAVEKEKKLAEVMELIRQFRKL